MTTLPKTPELISVFRSILWPPKQSLSEWADAHIVLGSEEPEPGAYRTDRFPLAREIQDTFTDSRYNTMVMWGPTQSAKTRIMSNAIGYIIHRDPAPTLVYYPVEISAADFSRKKLGPMIRSTPVLAERASVGNAREMPKTVLMQTYPGMTLELLGAASENAFAGRTAKNVFADEIDRMAATKEGDTIELIKKRAQNFWNRKVVLGSTCTIKGQSRIEAEYENSDQRKYYVPCLKCGHKHVMEWENIDFDHEENPSLARKKARYRCPSCSHEHYDRDKAAMLAGGEWRKHKPEAEVAGFWWSALYSPWVTFGDLAYEFRKAKDDDDGHQVFLNTRLSKTYKPKTEAPTETILDNCIDRDRQQGKVPEDAVLLTGGVDVQKHVAYWVVRAWGAEGKSWLISHGVYERDGDTLAGLDDVFAVTYGGHEVRQVLIDSGWDEEVVYDHCLHRRNCAPSKGAGADVDFLVKESELTRDKGRFMGRRFVLWRVNSHRIRANIHDRIPIPAGEPRSWRLHAEVDREYMRQLLAKERQEKHVKGKSVIEWVDVRRDDHFLDAEIYAFAAAKLPHISPLLVVGKRPAKPKTVIVSQREGSRGSIRRSY